MVKLYFDYTLIYQFFLVHTLIYEFDFIILELKFQKHENRNDFRNCLKHEKNKIRNLFLKLRFTFQSFVSQVLFDSQTSCRKTNNLCKMRRRKVLKETKRPQATKKKRNKMRRDDKSKGTGVR